MHQTRQGALTGSLAIEKASARVTPRVDVIAKSNAMGLIEPKRIQVKLLKPDLALALTWWSVSFPSSKQKVVGNTTMNLQKFNDGWKIVASHTSIAEM
jgi:hypothetical protein